MTLKARPDMITHVPMDEALDSDTIVVIKAASIVFIPAFTMQEALCNIKVRLNVNYSDTRVSVERQLGPESRYLRGLTPTIVQWCVLSMVRVSTWSLKCWLRLECHPVLHCKLATI